MKMTKHISWVAVLVFSAGTFAAKAQTSAPVKDDLFAGTEVFAKGASDVTEITMDPDTLGMVGGTNKAKAHTMVLNVVRTYEYDKPGMYRIEDVDAFRNKLNTGDWHCSVHTRSLKTGESTDVCNKRRGDDMLETAIITVEPKELTFIHTIRKRGEGEHGEIGEFSPLYSISGLTSLAMIRPDINLDVSMAMAKIDSAEMSARMAAGMKNFKFDDTQLKKQMDGAQKQMKDFKFEFKDGVKPFDSNDANPPKDKATQPE